MKNVLPTIGTIEFIASNYEEDCSDSSKLSNDPSLFCMMSPLSETMVNFLLKKGPMQPQNEDMPHKIFPSNKYGRSFQPSWYWKNHLGIYKYQGIG